MKKLYELDGVQYEVHREFENYVELVSLTENRKFPIVHKHSLGVRYKEVDAEDE